MKFILFSISIFFYFSSASQPTGSEAYDIVRVVDEMPEYPGGKQALYNNIEENLRYTDKARLQGIEGKVYVEFIVTEAGKMVNYRVVKGIGYGLNEEAIKALNSLPEKFSPAIKGGKAVSFKMILPIYFKIS